MICLTPISVEYPKGSKHYIGVPCGKCVNCVKTRVNEWTFRLKKELQVSKNAFFVTLTYANECLPRSKIDGSPQVCKADVQKFFKRLRKNEQAKLKEQSCKIRYFLVAEYGGNTGRPHYHALLFNLPVAQGYKGDIEAVEMIYKAWQYGAVNIGSVTPNSIAYCAHYSTAWHYLGKDGQVRPFMLCSRKPPIGDAYLHSSHFDWVDNNFCLYDYDVDHVVSVPRYYRRKLEKKYEQLEDGQQVWKQTRQSLVRKYIVQKQAARAGLSPEQFAARLKAADENLKRFIQRKKQHV